MRKLINTLIIGFLIILLSSTTVAQSNFVYSLTLVYKSGQFSDYQLTLIEGSAPERLDQPEEGFTLKVLSFDNQVLHSFKFLVETTPVRAPPRDVFTENGTQIAVPETITKLDETTIVLVVPYFENAKSIDIFDQGDKLLLSVDVSKYSKAPTGLSTLTIFIIIAIGIVAFIIVSFFYVKKRHKVIVVKHHKRGKK